VQVAWPRRRQPEIELTGDRAYSVVAPRFWNELPADIRSCSSIEAFKKQLKTHLFTSIFNVL
jgi:hypothetical protein